MCWGGLVSWGDNPIQNGWVLIYNNVAQPKERVMEKKKQNPQHKSLKKTPSKKSVATKKSSVAKRKNANETHWIESRARLVKIMEAAGFAPEKCAIMITHRKRPDR